MTTPLGISGNTVRAASLGSAAASHRTPLAAVSLLQQVLSALAWNG